MLNALFTTIVAEEPKIMISFISAIIQSCMLVIKLTAIYIRISDFDLAVCEQLGSVIEFSFLIAF